jgi:hypothetical protein
MSGRASRNVHVCVVAAKRHAHRARVRAALKDLLTLWRDADPDIPILKQAKAEYAKLQ